jgi:methylmalonyl-CoA mutase
VRRFHAETSRQAERAADAWACQRALGAVSDPAATPALRGALDAALADLEPELRRELLAWPETRARYQADTQSYEVRGQTIRVANRTETLAKTLLPKVALPRGESWGELARYLRRENVPGRFPFTAGVFPFKRENEDPARMFAGEGTPERTNRRFHLLSAGQPAVRGSRPPSTARRSTAAIPQKGSTSGARSATRACRSAPSTTPRSSTRDSISATPRPPCR